MVLARGCECSGAGERVAFVFGERRVAQVHANQALLEEAAQRLRTETERFESRRQWLHDQTERLPDGLGDVQSFDYNRSRYAHHRVGIKVCDRRGALSLSFFFVYTIIKNKNLHNKNIFTTGSFCKRFGRLPHCVLS